MVPIAGQSASSGGFEASRPTLRENYGSRCAIGGFKFVRQEAIGPFVADLIGRDQNLVIEVDGGRGKEAAACL